MTMVVRAWQWILLLFSGKPEEEPTDIAVVPSEAPPSLPDPAVAAPRKTRRVSPAVQTGEYYFREQILDQLEAYFRIIKTMKKADPLAYGLYAKLGASLLPQEAVFDKPTELSWWWNDNRPGFGAVAFAVANRAIEAQGKAEAKYYPRFIYFRKYSTAGAPVEIERASGGDVYVVTAFWQTDEDGGLAVPTEFPVLVGPDRSVRLLRTLKKQALKIRAKRGQDRGKTFTVYQKSWGVHAEMEDWAKEHHQEAATFLVEKFILAANLYEAAHTSMIRVDVAKARLHAVFGVDITRTPYFFRDRDLVLNEKGSRKRIFHIVRPHQRETGALVKMHFRGDRIFKWNGYDVRITVPGVHHFDLTRWDLSMADADSAISLGENGKHLADVVEVAGNIRARLDA